MRAARWAPALSCAALAAAPPASAAEVDAEVDHALAVAPPAEEMAVILAFPERDLPAVPLPGERAARRRRVVTILRDRASAAQAETMAALRSPHFAGRIASVRSLWIVNAVALTGEARAIRAITALPQAFRLELDRSVPQPSTTLAAAARPGWGIDAIGVRELAQAGVFGRGAVVAVLDSGVDLAHPLLRVTYRGGLNSWYDPYGKHPDPFDATGHGTQVAGIAAGGAPIGVAPGARWIAARIFDGKRARTSAIHAAFQWTLDPDDDPETDDAPDVVNGSWSLGNVGTCDRTFHADLLALRAAEIVPVFAAGNAGPAPGTSVSPANDPLALAVGGIDQTGGLDAAGSRGPSACGGGLYPALAAPGVRIHTADLSLGGRLTYATATGASIAAPHVSGALALLFGAFPGASAARVEDALLRSAAGLGLGHGRLDARAAYAMLAADADGDGASSAYDCDDGAPAVHPGAAEAKRDGIDQDCNGYDLTIDVLVSQYDGERRSLRVEASSALGPAADLDLVGFGRMAWDARASRWVKSVSGLVAEPALVSVIGIEGAESAPITQAPRRAGKAAP